MWAITDLSFAVGGTLAFKIDKAGGTLQRTGDVVKTGSPVCIVFRPLP